MWGCDSARFISGVNYCKIIVHYMLVYVYLKLTVNRTCDSGPIPSVFGWIFIYLHSSFQRDYISYSHCVYRSECLSVTSTCL